MKTSKVNWRLISPGLISTRSPRHVQSVLEDAQRDIVKIMDQRTELLIVLMDLQESAGYWSEYDVPIGIVERINDAIEKVKGEPV